MRVSSSQRTPSRCSARPLGDVRDLPGGEHPGALGGVGPGAARELLAAAEEAANSGRVRETTCRSYSPSIVEMFSSVRGSAMPGRISLVPNRVRNPSACAPHRCRACERSCSAASRRRPWPPPSDAICGQLFERGDVRDLIEREQHAAAGRAARRRTPGRRRGGSQRAARTRSVRRPPAPPRARGCRRSRPSARTWRRRSSDRSPRRARVRCRRPAGRRRRRRRSRSAPARRCCSRPRRFPNASFEQR